MFMILPWYWSIIISCFFSVAGIWLHILKIWLCWWWWWWSSSSSSSGGMWFRYWQRHEKYADTCIMVYIYVYIYICVCDWADWLFCTYLYYYKPHVFGWYFTIFVVENICIYAVIIMCHSGYHSCNHLVKCGDNFQGNPWP